MDPFIDVNYPSLFLASHRHDDSDDDFAWLPVMEK